jgi:hypothetical protein
MPSNSPPNPSMPSGALLSELVGASFSSLMLNYVRVAAQKALLLWSALTRFQTECLLEAGAFCSKIIGTRHSQIWATGAVLFYCCAITQPQHRRFCGAFCRQCDRVGDNKKHTRGFAKLLLGNLSFLCDRPITVSVGTITAILHDNFRKNKLG